MSGEYNLNLVVLSVIVAAIAAYTALDLAGRVSSKRGTASWLWLSGGASAMGTGIWSMHFIGMLAFSLPIPMAYDFSITMLSMLIAIVVSGFALFVVSRPVVTTKSICIGAAIMGIGICSMHYTGMAAMRMSPPITYDPLLFVASVLIAIAASLAALWLAFQLRRRYSALALLAKLGSAFVMGFAITGMHYTGMAAAQFAPGSVCLAAGASGGFDTDTLAMIIGAVTVGILTITLVISAYDTHVAALTAKHADSLQAANQQLRTIALYDNLTGLPNRMLLEDRLQQVMHSADRNDGMFALIYIDLDEFKPVNDSFGHHVGDHILETTAERLRACVRKEDTVARVGGDEFVIVLNKIDHADDAATISNKVLAGLSDLIHVDGRELAISCSIGISVYPRDGTDSNTLMINADAAMYHAKKSGRNNYRFFAP